MQKQPKQQIPDKALMYASIFSYRPNERFKLLAYQLPDKEIVKQQNLGNVPQESLILLQGFVAASEADQREKWLEKKPKLEELLRVLFKVLDNVQGDSGLNLFILAHINGILEDKRTRVRSIVAMEKSANESKKVEAMKILFNFLQKCVHKGEDALNQRDLAAHTLSQIISASDYQNCEDISRNLLNYLV